MTETDLLQLAIAVCILTLAPTGVHCGAVLQLNMVKYDNSAGKDWNDKYCDGISLANCDHIFRFGLDLANDDSTAQSSHYWSYLSRTIPDEDVNLFGADIAGIKNPIVSTLSPRWPGSVKFQVYVEDEDIEFHDHVDSLVKVLQLTPAKSESSDSWKEIVIQGMRTNAPTSLTMRYKLYCEQDFYTVDCSVHCLASEHYTCDSETGSPICKPGWEDPSAMCKIFADDCVDNFCQNGATCVDANRTYTCACPAGFTGRICEVNMDECAGNPCHHNGTCEDLINDFKCHCPPGFTGRRCSDMVSTTIAPSTPGSNSKQPYYSTYAARRWFYASFCVVFVLFAAVVALSVCLYRQHSAVPKTNEANYYHSVSYERSPKTSAGEPQQESLGKKPDANIYVVH